ncbi:MAG: TIGR00153 family protein [Parachlamydiales bacterium]|jgi:predicted phosphate transport protein (TIGR00153 family)|nr:TIGR00153 family protein [Verrucomicrobiota bacterium]MBX3718023.1 TIGR00153 family protein [Candidatus Acheromyda pituitae]
MLNIARLFGKSPFAPLQSHMKKVAICMEKLSSVFAALPKLDMDKIEKLVQELSKLEHEADLTKNDIRNHLPKSLFLPIDRAHFLEILSIQDSIADKAEDIGILLTLRPLDKFKNFQDDIQALFKKNEEVFLDAQHIIEEIDELLESSFGGIEAEKVKAMVEQTAYKEHEADKMQRILLKQLVSQGDSLSTASFWQWMRLVEEVGALSHLSEKLANRIRMVLELK